MQVAPNQLIELHIDGSSGLQIYRSRVEDAYDDLLIVGAPIDKGSLVPIRVGTRLSVQFKHSGPIQEGRFENIAVVEKRFSANLPLLQLRLLTEWHKVQDRSFVRVPVFLDAVFTPFRENEKGIAEEGQPQTGVILNLSGGGFLLRTTYELQMDEEIKISFEFDDTPVLANAHVARFVPTEEGQDYGFAFSEIPEQIRTQIIQYVFKRQIELLR